MFEASRFGSLVVGKWSII